MASTGGVAAVIASGHRDGALLAAASGAAGGTRFRADPRPLSAYKLWIRYGKPVRGRLEVDDGARRAVVGKGTSLLAVGLSAVEGSFGAGDAVEIRARRRCSSRSACRATPPPTCGGWPARGGSTRRCTAITLWCYEHRHPAHRQRTRPRRRPRAVPARPRRQGCRRCGRWRGRSGCSASSWWRPTASIWRRRPASGRPSATGCGSITSAASSWPTRVLAVAALDDPVGSVLRESDARERPSADQAAGAAGRGADRLRGPAERHRRCRRALHQGRQRLHPARLAAGRAHQPGAAGGDAAGAGRGRAAGRRRAAALDRPQPSWPRCWPIRRRPTW